MCMIGRPSKLIHVLIFKPTCNILTFHILGTQIYLREFQKCKIQPHNTYVLCVAKIHQSIFLDEERYHILVIIL